MIIYFATWLEDNQGKTLTGTDANNRLLSYYFLKDAGPDFIKQYVTSGKIEKESK